MTQDSRDLALVILRGLKYMVKLLENFITGKGDYESESRVSAPLRQASRQDPKA